MSELTKRLRAKYPGIYDDLDDAALEKAVLAKHPEYADLAQPESKVEIPAQPQGDLGRFGGYKMLGDAAISAVKSAIAHPVQTGAILGGLAAVPLTGGVSLAPAAAAAGLGAAGGAGIGAIVNAARGGENGPRSAADVGKTMATEGALGAAGEGIGRGVVGGLRLGGKLLYKGVLRPSIPLQREFGDVAAKGLEEGARVSEAGMKRIQGRIASNSDEAARMIAEAEKAGAAPVTTKEVASEFGDVFTQGRRQARLGRPDPRPAVYQRLQDFGAKNPVGIPLSEAQALKSEAQDLATRAYRAADRGGPMTDLSAEADKAMARGLRKGIEARVPRVGPVNADIQGLIGVARALEDASYRNQPGIGTIRTLLGGFMPGTTSGAAILADRVSRAPIPQTFKAALIAALGGQE